MIGLAQRFVVLRVVCPLFINFYFSFLSRPNRLCFGSSVRRFVLLFAFAERAVPLHVRPLLALFLQAVCLLVMLPQCVRHAFG
jgi:hypothetical protein